MKILHCINTHEFAGTERHVADLAAAQSESHDVTVLISRHTHDQCTGGDIRGHLAPSLRKIHAGKAGYYSSLVNVLNTIRPDVIHTHLGKASFRARFAPFRTAPLIATLHNRFRQRVYGAHDGLICVARWQLGGVPENFGGCVDVIGNWTSPPPKEDPDRRERLRKRLGVTDNQFLIGAAGRFVPEKCFDVLIKAFKRAGIPGARLVLFGDGPERERLEALGSPDIIFAGFSHTLREDMWALDGFALPSRHEPFGLVLLEAMAADLPVVATRAGGVCDILRDHEHAFVEPDDVDSLVGGLVRLHVMGKRRWDMRNFMLEQKLERVESFYRRCQKETGHEPAVLYYT